MPSPPVLDFYMWQRHAVAALWTSTNPILGPGEIGFETDTGAFKFGNGTDVWTARPYAGTVGGFSVVGENYLTLAGTVLTAHPVDLSTTNVTGLLPFSKIANATANSKLVGAGAAGIGLSYAEITLGSNLSMSGTTLNAASSGGTVTTVSVVTNQGISGSVANATTTPAITLTVGALTGISSVNGLVITANTGVITTGTWNGGIIGTVYGGTGVDNSTGGTANQFWARPNGSTGAAAYRAIVGADIPTLNQNTTGTANIAGGTLGAIPYQSGANATTVLAATSTANKILLSGASAAPVWSTPTFPNASATALKLIRSDGTNWIASTSTFSDSPGTAGKVLISDGTNWITSTPTFPNASATSRKIIVSDGTNWIASTETWPTPGSNNNILRSDGTNWTSIATPTWNQNTTGSAATLTTPRAIYGNNFDGSAALTQIIAATYGGSNNAFFQVSGPASSIKTFTFPNASCSVLTDNAAVTVLQGGTGQTLYVTGDLLYASAATTLSRLPDVATGNALISGGVTTAPSWGKIDLTAHVSGQLPLANIADIATSRFLGRTTAGTGIPEALTPTQATALLNNFTSSLAGLAPSSGGGTANYLRADGTWAAPAGSGSVTTVSVVTANGVSGSVANPASTPAITLTLGAITPSSVAASGTVTGSNLSGTNTGDQTRAGLWYTGYYLLSDYGGVLSTACAAIGSAIAGELRINVPCTIAADFDQTTNYSQIIFTMENTGSFTVSSGKKLTLANFTPVSAQQWFFGAGKTVFARNATGGVFHIEWWAGIDSGSTNIDAAMLQAIESQNNNRGGILYFGSNVRIVTGDYVPPNGSIWQGAGSNNDSASGTTALKLVTGSSSKAIIKETPTPQGQLGFHNVVIRDMILDAQPNATNANCYPFQAVASGTLYSGYGLTFDNVTFQGGKYGCYWYESDNFGTWENFQVRYINCTWTGQSSAAFRCETKGSMTFENPSIYVDAGVHGFDMYFAPFVIWNNPVMTSSPGALPCVGGQPNTGQGGTCYRFTNTYVAATINNHQDEGMAFGIQFQRALPFMVTLNNCAFQSMIEFNGTGGDAGDNYLNIIGGSYYANSIRAVSVSSATVAVSGQIYIRGTDLCANVDTTRNLCNFAGTGALLIETASGQLRTKTINVPTTVTAKLTAIGTTTPLSVAYDATHVCDLTPDSTGALAFSNFVSSPSRLLARLASNVTYNNTSTLTNTALSVTVLAGTTYAVTLKIYAQDAVKGAKLDFAGGSATFTSFLGEWQGGIEDQTGLAGAVVSANTTVFAPTSVDGAHLLYYTFNGTVTFNAAGTFILRGAQNAADASNTSFFVGSTLILDRIA